MRPYVLEQGNAKAPASRDFEEQLLESRKRVSNLAFRMLCNRSDAEDITQETLVRAWSVRASFDPARSLDAWVLRIATNLCIDQLRRRRRRVEVSLDSPLPNETEGAWGSHELADLSQDPERVLLAQEIDEALLRGLQALPDAYRICVMLLEQEHSYEEIATKLHCPIGTVRSRLHRARRHLKRVMER